MENQSFGLKFTRMTSRMLRTCSDLLGQKEKIVIPTSNTSLIGSTQAGKEQ